jgi:hypothetical protein
VHWYIRLAPPLGSIIKSSVLGHPFPAKNLLDCILQISGVESRFDPAPPAHRNSSRSRAKHCCHEFDILFDTFIDAHLESAEHNGDESVLDVNVQIDGPTQPHLPASTCATYEIKHFARLDRGKIPLLAVVIQSIHDTLQDVERRKAAISTAIKR